MRMDKMTPITAADVIAYASELDLWRIFKYYGEEKHCKLIARAIVESRFSIEPVRTTQQLAKLVELVCGFSFRLDKLQRKAHVATKIFQALRIFVNNEINELNFGLIVAQKYLKVDGRLAAISFHSLEDTVVKRFLQDNVIDNAVSPVPLKYVSFGVAYDEKDMAKMKECRWEKVNKHVILPSDDEITVNPRARSAKLRVGVKVS